MPSFSTILKGLFVLAPLAAAAPAQLDIRSVASASATSSAATTSATAAAAAAAKPSAAAAKPASGLTDVDILNL